MIPVFVIIPLAAAFLMPLVGKVRTSACRYCAIAAQAAMLAFSIAGMFWIRTGVKVYTVGGWRPPFGICMELDGLTVLLLVVINFIGFLALVYSASYMRRFSAPVLYYTLFALLLAGLNGVAISGDLFNMFVFLEIASIASYALVAFGVESDELEASFKYVVLGSLSSAFILLAIGLLWGIVSTLNMADIAQSLAHSPRRNVIMLCVGFFVMGFGLKTGLVPFHTWLPDAHPSAPAPVSAMLSGVVIKTLGIYALVRVMFNIIGFSPVIASLCTWLGIVSMIVGVLLAIGQWDIKRLLAYHSVSQVGSVLFGIGLGTPLGIVGGLFHLLNHSLFKSLLFLNAGSIEYATGKRDLRLIAGLNESMPGTSATSLIASMSIAGIPPLCGFFSKLLIVIAAFQAGHWVGVVACLAVGAVTLASFLKVQKYAFSRRRPDEGKDAHIREVPASMMLAQGILAIACIGAGLFAAVVIAWLIVPAARVLLEGTNYAQWVLGG
jgi:multicomponent Na+:H+ antiporter subunit D